MENGQTHIEDSRSAGSLIPIRFQIDSILPRSTRFGGCFFGCNETKHISRVSHVKEAFSIDWKDFNHDGPADGRMILARFTTGPIECRCELDGFYTRDDRLITDSLGGPAMPDAWLPIAHVSA